MLGTYIILTKVYLSYVVFICLFSLFYTLTFTDYHFVTREAMEEAINNKEFIEHAEYSRNLYGTRQVLL